jgi:copper chaperone CopZ
MAVLALGSDYDTRRALALKAALARIRGVASVDFNYITNRVTVSFDPDKVGPKELEGVITREKKHKVGSTVRSQNRRRAEGGLA